MEPQLSVGQADQPQTMVYTVDLGNGHVVDIEGPPNATPEQLQSFVAQQPQFNGQEVATQGQGMFADEQPPQVQSKMSPEQEQQLLGLIRGGASADDLRAAAQKMGFQFNTADEIVKARDSGQQYSPDVVYSLPKVETDTAGSFGRGVADTLTFGTLPKVGAAIAGTEAALRGEGFGDAYNRQLDYNNAAIGSDEQDHGWARVFGQLVGGFGLPSGLEGVGFSAGKQALRAGATMAEARAAAASAIRSRMAAVGGGFGAAHGAGSGDNPADMLSGALTEGALGAATGGLLGQAGRMTKAEEKVTQAVDDGKDIYQAAQRQGIQPMAADVGGPLIRGASAFAAKTPFGSTPVIEGAKRVSEQAQAARNRIASSVGQALDPESAGEAMQLGAQKFIASSKNRVDNLYRMAESAAGDARVTPSKAIETLDRNIAELSDTPGGAPALDTLNGLRDALANGDVSVGGLRRMRTVLRDQFMKDGLRNSDTERRVNQVLDAAREDITNGLNDQGRSKAASLFVQADAAHAERVRTIDTVLKPLIGTRDAPKSGEQVASQLTRDLKSNNARAVKFLRMLPDEERANATASIIGNLGHLPAGQQNATGDAFSLPAFLTNWNNIGDTAKRAYFGDEARAALNDLAKVAEGSKAALKYANHSNSGGIMEFGRLATALTALPTAGGVIAGPYALGRLLASPRFVRWLARAPKTSLSAPAYADRLTRIARAEPAIANEVLTLQQRLTDAFSSSNARLAAQEPVDGVGQGQGNAGDGYGQNGGQQP